jgi:hypothetical protein
MVMPPSGESQHWCIVLVVVEGDGSLVLVAEPPREAVPCPKCGQAADRALLCVDGVHGIGVEDVDLPTWGATFSSPAVTSGCWAHAAPGSCGAIRAPGRQPRR